MVVIPDVSDMDDQRPTTVFKCTECREFRRKSEVPTVRSSDMYREFRHFKYSNSVAMVFKYTEGWKFHVSREFRRSEVLTFIGSSDASQIDCNLVIVGAV